jgi:hypothetical protein
MQIPARREECSGCTKPIQSFCVPCIAGDPRVVDQSRGVVDQVAEPHPRAPRGQVVDVLGNGVIGIDQSADSLLRHEHPHDLLRDRGGVHHRLHRDSEVKS